MNGENSLINICWRESRKMQVITDSAERGEEQQNSDDDDGGGLVS